jgi:hypothetical protein
LSEAGAGSNSDLRPAGTGPCPNKVLRAEPAIRAAIDRVRQRRRDLDNDRHVPVVLMNEHDDQVMRRCASRVTSFLASVSYGTPKGQPHDAGRVLHVALPAAGVHRPRPGADRGRRDGVRDGPRLRPRAEIAANDLDAIDRYANESIGAEAGNSAQELRTWVAAYDALGAAGPYEVTSRYYRPIPEFIAGFGVTTAVPASATVSSALG